MPWRGPTGAGDGEADASFRGRGSTRRVCGMRSRAGRGRACGAVSTTYERSRGAAGRAREDGHHPATRSGPGRQRSGRQESGGLSRATACPRAGAPGPARRDRRAGGCRPAVHFRDPPPPRCGAGARPRSDRRRSPAARRHPHPFRPGSLSRCRVVQPPGLVGSGVRPEYGGVSRPAHCFCRAGGVATKSPGPDRVGNDGRAGCHLEPKRGRRRGRSRHHLLMVRVDLGSALDGAFRPAGALSVFAVHGTGIRRKTISGMRTSTVGWRAFSRRTRTRSPTEWAQPSHPRSPIRQWRGR